MEISSNFIVRPVSNSDSKYKRVPIKPTWSDKSWIAHSRVWPGRSHTDSLRFTVQITNNSNNKLMEMANITCTSFS
jgi:hypothetical protein